ncbi:MAG: hypothetical protein ACLTMP_03180 [Eggerthella lenta]
MGLQFASARRRRRFNVGSQKRSAAANFPGKIALYADPRVIADLAPRLQKGSVCVVGTNGKTTVTNLLADALETAGQRVVCNRTGANLDSGVATALLHAREADWGVFECDELWLAKILPHLQANYVVLLNLFRDQLNAWARSTASRTASWARWRSRRARCWCTTPTTRCASASPSVQRTLPSRSAWTGPGAAAEFGGRRADVPALLVHVGIRLSPVRAAGIVRVPPVVRAPPWTSRQRA